MERLHFAFLISLLLCTCGCVTDLDQEYGHAVRPIGVGGQEAWNRRSVWFMYAPTFDFTNRSDAVKYVFDVTDSAGAELKLEQSDFVFPSPVKPGEKRPAIWDCVVRENRNQSCHFVYG